MLSHRCSRFGLLNPNEMFGCFENFVTGSSETGTIIRRKLMPTALGRLQRITTVLAAGILVLAVQLVQAEPKTKLIWPQVTPILASTLATVDNRETNAHQVKRVIDATHVVVMIDNQETTVQLAGVDWPDPGLRSEEQFAAVRMEANRFMDSLLRGESVYLENQELQGDSLRANVFRAPDGLFVNAEIIRQGFGHTAISKENRFASIFHYCQQRARETRKGFWTKMSTTVQTEPRNETDPPTQSTAQVMVYVDESGSMYHTAGCPQLRENAIPIAIYKAVTGFEWCNVCKPAR